MNKFTRHSSKTWVGKLGPLDQIRMTSPRVKNDFIFLKVVKTRICTGDQRWPTEHPQSIYTEHNIQSIKHYLALYEKSVDLLPKDQDVEEVVRLGAWVHSLPGWFLAFYLLANDLVESFKVISSSGLLSSSVK